MQVRIEYSNLPKLIILTGPQGSGNHLFSKVLALNPVVHGWQDLLDEYWIGHDKEPFAKYWADPEQLDRFDWSQSKVFVTSISCPYALNGEYVNPNYASFIKQASKYVDIQIVIIARDKTIVESQQERVRGQITLPNFYDNMDLLTQYPHIFVSQEALKMYGIWYLHYVERELGLPESVITVHHNNILSDDANCKYIKNVSEQTLDKIAQKASSKWR
jgi:hypothetical protein